MKLADQMMEVEREIATRKRVFPNWVANGKIKQEDADKRIKALEAVLETLTAVFMLLNAK